MIEKICLTQNNNKQIELVAIYAMTPARVIGSGGKLPWHLPADLAHFRRHSRGKPNIMGRRVWDSLGGKPLPNRTNIVLTRNRNFVAEGALVAHTPEKALELALLEQPAEIAIIGGAEIYALYAAQLTRLEETLIHADIRGDTYMPPLGAGWHEITRDEYPADGQNLYPMTFRTLIRSLR